MTDVKGNHLAKVRIKDLLLRAYIGIKEEEIDKPHALRYAESVSVCLQAHR